MICPHCETNLKRKQRGGRRCSSCRKQFVLDPKGNALQLHDVRVRKLVDRLSLGRYFYTAVQLWYAASLKAVRARASNRYLLTFGLLALGIALIILGVVLKRFTPIFIGLLWSLASGAYLVARLTGWWKKKITVPMDLGRFHREVIQAWPGVYGSALPGLVDEHNIRPDHRPAPALAVLSPDRDVLICLRVNGVPEQFNAALVGRLADLPPTVPVLLLHDASCDGLVFAAQTRTALAGRRVLDLGLRPRTVMTANWAVRLRTAPPPTTTIGWLRATGRLTEPELDWLAKGWWTPVAAMRPPALIARVTAAAERLKAADPAQRAAAAVGFLTWPGAAGGAK